MRGATAEAGAVDTLSKGLEAGGSRRGPTPTRTSSGGPPAWRRDFGGRRSEMPLPSRLARLLWWDVADLGPRGSGGLLGRGGASSASPRPRRCPSLVMDAPTSAGFTDAIGSTVSLAGEGEAWCTRALAWAGQLCPGSHATQTPALHPHPGLPPLAV